MSLCIKNSIGLKLCDVSIVTVMTLYFYALTHTRFFVLQSLFSVKVTSHILKSV